jgi:hypothetical protein
MSLPNLTREQGIEIGKIELEFSVSITSALYWQLRRDDGYHQTKNGSVFFVDGGSGLFAITASHVLAQYRSDRATFEQVGDLRIAGEGGSLAIELSRLIDEDIDLDIATRNVTTAEIEHLHRSAITLDAVSWPPNPPSINADIVFCGFPGHMRRSISERELHVGAVVSTGPASSVSDKDISLLIDRAELIPVIGEEVSPQNFDFGGISGGPFLSVTRSPIRHLSVAGVIYQGPNTSNNPDEAIAGLEIIRARRGYFLRPDGHLDLPLWRSLNL